MQFYTTDPIFDKRWGEFVANEPRASVFHQPGWLQALAQTYGYKPFVVTNSHAGAPINEGIVFCGVSSWMTGSRVVSLPFSDHCEPLISCEDQLSAYMNWAQNECDHESYKYLELRPLTWSDSPDPLLASSQSYYLHTLDLTASLENIFGRFHKDSVQRRIKKAEKEKLSFEVGRTEQFVEEFYGLQLMTRRRQLTLPQPLTWFHSLAKCMGEQLQIWLARKNGVAVAALLTLRHQSKVVYKYGCSNENFHYLGGMPFLFWQLIQQSKSMGAIELDFGRSDLNDEGLVRFKDRFGTKKKLLKYFRYSPTGKKQVESASDSSKVRQIISYLPYTVCRAAGSILYKHMG